MDAASGGFFDVGGRDLEVRIDEVRRQWVSMYNTYIRRKLTKSVFAGLGLEADNMPMRRLTLLVRGRPRKSSRM